jgi:YHS domain-containing protein
MNHLRAFMRCLSVLVLAAMAGCSGQSQPGHKAGPPGAQQPAAPTSEPSAQGNSSAANVPQGLLELSAEDRATAQKQRICPVSGEVLGSMGKPVKVTVKGQTVFLCCSGCEEDIKKDPDKYLAKLKSAEAK